MMHFNDLLESLKSCDKIQSTSFTEFDASPNHRDLGCDRAVLFNIWLKELKTTDASEKLSICRDVVTALLKEAINRKEFESCAVGFSVFLPPWGPSWRAYAGWVPGQEISKAVISLPASARGVYSNVRDIIEILKREENEESGG